MNETILTLVALVVVLLTIDHRCVRAVFLTWEVDPPISAGIFMYSSFFFFCVLCMRVFVVLAIERPFIVFECFLSIIRLPFRFSDAHFSIRANTTKLKIPHAATLVACADVGALQSPAPWALITMFSTDSPYPFESFRLLLPPGLLVYRT